ncbi:MAG: antibiotic biosynthesis monooxygenase [Acidimicrobiales bacterium]
MHALSGYLEFPPGRREATLAALRAVSVRSRQDPGCIDYWWAEDVEHPDRFRFFECWETVEDFEGHQAQPYEVAFMDQYVSHITGADAHVLDIGGRQSVLGAEPPPDVDTAEGGVDR